MKMHSLMWYYLKVLPFFIFGMIVMKYVCFSESPKNSTTSQAIIQAQIDSYVDLAEIRHQKERLQAFIKISPLFPKDRYFGKLFFCVIFFHLFG